MRIGDGEDTWWKSAFFGGENRVGEIRGREIKILIMEHFLENEICVKKKCNEAKIHHAFFF